MSRTLESGHIRNVIPILSFCPSLRGGSAFWIAGTFLAGFFAHGEVARAQCDDEATSCDEGEDHPSFQCTKAIFLGQEDPTSLFTLELDETAFALVPVGNPAEVRYNALGYNVQDGYLYASSYAQEGSIVRIGADGTAVDLGRAVLATDPSVSLSESFFMGDVGPDGVFYLANTNELYRVYLGTSPPTYDLVPLSRPINCWDIAVNPRTRKGYCAENYSQIVAQIDLNTGEVTKFTYSGEPVAEDGNGAMWFDAKGRLYLYENSGHLQRVNLNTRELEHLGEGPSSTNNDGAACAFAAMLELDASPRDIYPGEATTYTFVLSHSGMDQDGDGTSDGLTGLSLATTSSFDGVWLDGTFEWSTDAETWTGSPPAGVAGTVGGLGSSMLTLSGLNIPGTKEDLWGYTLFFRADFQVVDGLVWGTLTTQATLNGLPDALGSVTLSDDPATTTLDDSTIVGVVSGDADGDRLTDQQEALLGTDPLEVDTDGDGLGDGDEVLVYNTNPLSVDTDEDGLSDRAEIVSHLTDPLDPDTDDDGLSDGDEVTLYATSPLAPDTDEDGLPDADEVLTLGTDPLDPDTDNDGLADGDEVLVVGTDPLEADTDTDGLTDFGEVTLFGTDPLDPDTDGGGLSDGQEVGFGLDPLDPTDDLTDSDNDGLSDFEEAMEGTDPTNPDTDGDGLSDGDELNLTGTDPLNEDTDDDGLSDGIEVNETQTDPLDADTDDGGVSDGDEVANDSDPLDPDDDDLCSIDEDNDGFGTCVDCDDADPSTHPGADELPDGIDNDCDGRIDEDAGCPGGPEGAPDPALAIGLFLPLLGLRRRRR